jgi:hypothetical protein
MYAYTIIQLVLPATNRIQSSVVHLEERIKLYFPQLPLQSMPASYFNHNLGKQYIQQYGLTVEKDTLLTDLFTKQVSPYMIHTTCNDNQY